VISPKMRAVVKREYLQQVRNKAFWISTFLIPSIALAIIFFQVLLSKSLVAKGRVGVVDLSGRLYDTLLAEQQARGDSQDERAKEQKDERQEPGTKPKRIETRIEFFKVDATKESLPEMRKKLNKDVQTEKIKAYIVLDGKTLDTGAAEWRAQSVKADLVMRETVAELLSRAATKERLKDRGVEPRLYDQARLRVDLEPHEAKEIETAAGGKNEGFNLAVSAVFFFLIYVSVFIYGGYIMRGVLEEKNNRIVEVIISSVRPADLMFGKILGIGLVGLTQYLIWGTLAVLLTLPAIVGMIGMTGGLPPIPLETIGAFILFFILGYFLYASVYAALAAPFNTEQEAQQFVMIPSMLLVLASTTWFFVYNSPNGLLAQTLSFFPFTAPLLMFMRISVQPPPIWQIGLSVAILLAAIWGMAWFAGRVYRVGILMYGKKPTLPEIIRWARAE
jgi:ABC-2 type transport system permease protein